jgi:energy-coupling factor transport system substrate-specific component
MLTLGWIGGGAGWIGLASARWPRRIEIAALAAYGWLAGFAFGAVMNLWFWPFALGDGPLSWHPGLALGTTVHRYYSFYVATSLAWDAAGAVANAVLIVITGSALLASLRRFAVRLAPVVELTA